MNKKIHNIPVKKISISNNTRIGRLSSQLNFLTYYSNIEIEYNKVVQLKNFYGRKTKQFYKFTGRINQPINYKKYRILYTYKYLKYTLKLQNITLKIINN